MTGSAPEVPAEPERRRRLADVVAEVLSGIDKQAWQSLADNWAERDHAGFAPGYIKYFDLPRWLPGAVRIARDLGLIGGPRLRILDIGCGPGHLLRVCRHLGHEGIGVDLGNPMFMAMCEILEVPCVTHHIVANEPLPKELRDFDLVTAIATKFHRFEIIDGVQRTYVWGGDAWRFFLADLALVLRSSGRFYVKLNLPEELPDEARPVFALSQQLSHNTFLFSHDALVLARGTR